MNQQKVIDILKKIEFTDGVSFPSFNELDFSLNWKGVFEFKFLFCINQWDVVLINNKASVNKYFLEVITKVLLLKDKLSAEKT